jgi:hypothetical protein
MVSSPFMSLTERILEVNALQMIAKEVVEAARKQLVIGPI